MNNKLPHLTWLLLILVVSSFFSAYAHPGRTDANGGHWNRQTGTYHFHTGEYSGKKSNDNSSSSKYKSFTPPYDPPAKNPYKQNDSKNNNLNNETSNNTNPKNIKSRKFEIVWNFIILIFIPIISTCYFCGFIYEIILENFLRNTKLLCNKIHEFQHFQTEIAETNIKIYGLESQLHVPDIYEFAEDNLPKDKQCNSNWGTSFTLYKSKTGNKLHSKYKCCSAVKPTHIYWYWKNGSLPNSLCVKCSSNYIVPDMSWYENSLQYNQAKLKKRRLKSQCQQLCDEIEKLHKKCNYVGRRWVVIFNNESKNTLYEANRKYNEFKNEIF